MPKRPAQPCTDARCNNLQPCPNHRGPAFLGVRRSGDRLYTSDWTRASAAFVVGKRCVYCGAPATQTDHEPAHRGDYSRFWDRSMWQPICDRCHKTKTAREVHERRFGVKVGGRFGSMNQDRVKEILSRPYRRVLIPDRESIARC